jgi:hypothetical protein
MDEDSLSGGRIRGRRFGKNPTESTGSLITVSFIMTGPADRMEKTINDFTKLEPVAGLVINGKPVSVTGVPVSASPISYAEILNRFLKANPEKCKNNWCPRSGSRPRSTP